MLKYDEFCIAAMKLRDTSLLSALMTAVSQMFGIGVDREAEQRQLHDRYADDHGERQPVAPELDELLEDDPPPARWRKSANVLS